jgi:hypothetical protein
MKVTLWLCCMLMLAVPVFGQLRSPSPAPAKSTESDKGKAIGKQDVKANDHRDADSLSSAVEKLIAEIASWKKQQSTAKDERNAPPVAWPRVSRHFWQGAGNAILLYLPAGSGVGFQRISRMQ